jgi:hypothetical protein
VTRPSPLFRDIIDRVTDRPSLPAALDFLVYAPLGAVSRLQREYPALVEEGRALVEGPGAMYRSIGELAVGQLRLKAEERAGELHRLLGSMGLVDPPSSAEDRAEESEPSRGGDAAGEACTEDGCGPLPIADYDELTASRIVPLLAGLAADEQDRIRRHEETHRARRTILGRLDRLAAARVATGGGDVR